jgi:hypothetical protein
MVLHQLGSMHLHPVLGRASAAHDIHVKSAFADPRQARLEATRPHAGTRELEGEQDPRAWNPRLGSAEWPDQSAGAGGIHQVAVRRVRVFRDEHKGRYRAGHPGRRYPDNPPMNLPVQEEWAEGGHVAAHGGGQWKPNCLSAARDQQRPNQLGRRERLVRPLVRYISRTPRGRRGPAHDRMRPQMHIRTQLPTRQWIRASRGCSCQTGRVQRSSLRDSCRPSRTKSDGQDPRRKCPCATPSRL